MHIIFVIHLLQNVPTAYLALFARMPLSVTHDENLTSSISGVHSVGDYLNTKKKTYIRVDVSRVDIRPVKNENGMLC